LLNATQRIIIFNCACFTYWSLLLLVLGISDSRWSAIRHCRKFREIAVQLFRRKEAEGGWNCVVLSRRQPFLIPRYRKLRRSLSVLSCSCPPFLRSSWRLSKWARVGAFNCVEIIKGTRKRIRGPSTFRYRRKGPPQL